MDAVGAQRGALLNCEKGTFTIQAVRGNDLRLGTAVLARVIEGKQSLLICDVEQDILLHDRQSILGSGIRSLLAVPIQTDDRVIGMIYLDTPAASAGFVTEDLNLLTVLANVAGMRIERERLAEIELADQVLAHELEQAAVIQRHLLPVGTPTFKGLQLAGCNTPCRLVGGDYYDYLVYPDRNVGLAIGDVAGKGMSAAPAPAPARASATALATNCRATTAPASRKWRRCGRDVPADP